MDVRSGNLLFLRGRGIVSRLIQLRSLSKFSHVGIAWRDGNGKLFVLESVEGHGVRLVPFSVWEGWRMPIDVYRVRLRRRESAFEWAFSQLGKDYASWRQFIRSWGVLGKRVSRLLHWRADEDPNRWFCSEYAARFLREAGIKLPNAPARLTPGDLSMISQVDHVGQILPKGTK